MPAPYWPMTYSASRRNHHHRCWACSRIIKDGEQVFMARLVGKKTRCLHEACASKKYDPAGRYTCLEGMEAWGMAYLAACGWKPAKEWMDTASICRASS